MAVFKVSSLQKEDEPKDDVKKEIASKELSSSGDISTSQMPVSDIITLELNKYLKKDQLIVKPDAKRGMEAYENELPILINPDLFEINTFKEIKNSLIYIGDHSQLTEEQLTAANFGLELGLKQYHTITGLAEAIRGKVNV